MIWYYARSGQRFGPIEEAELQRLAGAGQIAATDLVWRSGLPEWRQAGEVPEISRFFWPAPTPAPPPAPAPAVAPAVAPAPPSPYFPYAPPAAPLTPAPPYAYGAVYLPATVEYASFGQRFGALLIDQIILACLSFGLGMLIGLAMVAGGSTPTGEEAVFNVIGLVFSWVYYAGLESSAKMSTFGKRLLGLKVTNLQGQRIDFGRATGRYFGKILSALPLALGFITMISDERKQTWHDKMAGCLVLRQRP